ncbi:hypothetical protein C8R46DRAFT_1350650 [Mycena filopes]|nr:hypothetical protein C8R46DRAFT_1350650 [Mycena filopes]
MAFARPTSSRAPGNAPRGRSASSGASTGARTHQPNHATKSRTSSVSSTASSSSKPTPNDVARPNGTLNSRPTSACSHRSSASSSKSVSAKEEPEHESTSLPISEPLSSTSHPAVSRNPTPSGSGSGLQYTSDPLQVAAHVYPWMYMTSTLEACFKSAESTAEKDLEERAKEISGEESDISDQRARLEAERKIEFYEELATDKFATAAPSIMQRFLAHEDACTQLEAEALQLAMSQATLAEDEYSPMRPYNAMLDRLERLQREQRELHASIVALTQEDDSGEEGDEQPSARSQMIHVFSACLPILEARGANLQMAYELLEGAKENLAMSLHIESLEFSEPEDD